MQTSKFSINLVVTTAKFIINLVVLYPFITVKTQKNAAKNTLGGIVFHSYFTCFPLLSFTIPNRKKSWYRWFCRRRL